MEMRKRRSSRDASDTPKLAQDSIPSPAPKAVGLTKFITRVVVGFAMIVGFIAILYGGHIYALGLVIVLQTLLFRELVNVRYRAAAEKNIPWFRSVQWMWFVVALFYNYGDSFGAFIESSKIRFVPPAIVHYLRYHTWVSFSMYALLFVMSVLSLKKGYYKYQMGQYTWTIVTLGLIVFQTKYVLTNIFNGLFWFLFPVSLVICNDCFAFFCGKLFGRKFIKTPFLRLSPNKTWEGFIGAFLCTIVYAFFSSAFISQFSWLTCPVESFEFKLIPDPLTCTPRDVFIPHFYDVPISVARLIGRNQIQLLPIQLHSLWFAMFASVVSPFGGFYASAIKRTYNLKDFDSVIPGHGGVMDRMDCQLITNCFTTVYFNTFIRSPIASVPMILNLVAELTVEQKQDVLKAVQEMLQVMDTKDRYCLRVQNLPAALSTASIMSLLSHYGATRVRVLQRQNIASSGRVPGAKVANKLQKAIAIFSSPETQQNAQKRLQSLELAGHRLQVEVLGEGGTNTVIDTKSETWEAKSNGSVPRQPPLPKGLPPPPPVAVQNPLFAPAPLAPHLGLNYAPPPHLEYKYPKANESIVRNIANALIALPRFYTQVLHLMNKMNLPPPFDKNAIPGIFSLEQSVHQPHCGHGKKRRRTSGQSSMQIVEKEEEESGDDLVNAVRKEPSECMDTQSLLPSCDDTEVDIKACDSSRPTPHELIGKPLTRPRKGSSIIKSDALDTAFQLDGGKNCLEEASRSTRPGVISESEVKKLRQSPEELMKEPLMKFYVRGLPSSSIIVKNIAQAMDEKDLRSVFGYVLPSDMPLDSMKIMVLPAKGSAQISYPNEAVATAAVDTLHGIRLEGNVLIVSFYNTPVAVERWTLRDLERERMPEAQLASEKAMKKYQRGELSDTLYVKNLSKSVNLNDLFAVFGAVLPPEFGLEDLEIRHFTVGRMKCQAFVKYPTAQLASNALLQVHGVVLKAKPLVICFRTPQSD